MDNFNKDFDKKIKELANAEKIEVPKDIQDKIDETLKTIKNEEKPKSKIISFRKIGAIAACFVAVMIFALPNISYSYAKAAQNLPFLGKLFQVVTIREYQVKNGNELDIKEPQIKDPISESMNGGDIPQVAPQIAPDNNPLNEVNSEIQNLTDKIMMEFNEDNKEEGNKQSVYTNYSVIMNTDRWFSIKIDVHKVSASSYTYFKFYHIDKLTGKIVHLNDLFKDDSYNEILTAEIKKQMKQQMKENKYMVYWIEAENPEHEFVKLSEKQNYFLSDTGDLLIQFDKYEVGPGSLGTPCFVIEKDVFADIIKPEFKDIPQK